jgi:hypothetical protein
MKTFLAARGLFLAGLALILGTNVLVVAGALGNRRGTPEARVTLTERELALPGYRREENSGLALQVDWRILGEASRDDGFNGHWGSPAWLDAAKLEALGFRTAELRERSREGTYKQPLSREVFVVLEFDGAAHREALERAEAARFRAAEACPAGCADKDKGEALKAAESRLARERVSASRLFAVDAGLDAARLREAYPDRARYIITPGIVDVWRQARDQLRGHITRLSVSAVHVPLEFTAVLEGFPTITPNAGKPPPPPRYAVDLAVGRRLEPWVQNIRRLDPQG